MSEETPAILTEHVPEESSSIKSMGEILRLGRERRGMELQEAARQLRISLRQVVALEANDIASLPSPTFVRGFIRNYAKLLEIDPEPLLAIYRDTMSGGVANTASISLHSEEIPIRGNVRSAWVSYLIASLVTGVAAGSWWVYTDWRDKDPAQPALAVVPAPVVRPSVPLVVPQPPADAVIQVVPAVDVPLSVPDTQPVPPATSPVALSRISMKFSQQSWVRVTDRDGAEVFHKNKPENTEDFVEGNPPFKLEIGNAAGVQLSYNGQPVDLTPHTKANVAHFTLE